MMESDLLRPCLSVTVTVTVTSPVRAAASMAGKVMAVVSAPPAGLKVTTVPSLEDCDQAMSTPVSPNTPASPVSGSSPPVALRETVLDSYSREESSAMSTSAGGSVSLTVTCAVATATPSRAPVRLAVAVRRKVKTTGDATSGAVTVAFKAPAPVMAR